MVPREVAPDFCATDGTCITSTFLFSVMASDVGSLKWACPWVVVNVKFNLAERSH